MVNLVHSPMDFYVRDFKPTKLIAEDFKPNWLGRHIQWLKQDCEGWRKIYLIALATFEKQLLMASVIGWAVLYMANREARRLDARAAFFRYAENATCPLDDRIELATKTRVFNHVQEFVIENNVIWTRLRHHPDKWRPVFFDGFAEGRIPIELDLDGANLVVLDDLGNFHYKKVLREFRITEIKDWYRERFANAGVDFERDTYIAIDKSERDNWKDNWFSLPYISPIVNLFTKKRLRLLTGAKAWAISHRGRYNSYLEDKLQQQHPIGVGTTHLYVLEHTGKDIRKYDPWSPKHVVVNFPLPETSEITFKAENMDASASTIFAIGYETHKNNPEKCTLQIYTCLADIDSEGWTPYPLMKYDYFKHPDDPDVFVIPLPQWQFHPLPLNPGDFITKDINILQTGEGNNARELRVPGQCQGIKGFYFKKIDEQNWHFEALEDELTADINKDTALPLEIDNLEEFHTTVHDYTSQSVKFYGISDIQASASLIDFGQRSYHSKVILKLDQIEYELGLHRRKTLKNFFGLQGDYYEIVVPEELHQEEQLMQALKWQKVIPINISENQSTLTIQDQKASCFKFIFSILQ